MLGLSEIVRPNGHDDRPAVGRQVQIIDVPEPVNVLDRKRALRGVSGQNRKEKRSQKTAESLAHGFSQSLGSRLANLITLGILRATLAPKKRAARLAAKQPRLGQSSTE